MKQRGGHSLLSISLEFACEVRGLHVARMVLVTSIGRPWLFEPDYSKTSGWKC